MYIIVPGVLSVLLFAALGFATLYVFTPRPGEDLAQRAVTFRQADLWMGCFALAAGSIFGLLALKAVLILAHWFHIGKLWTHAFSSIGFASALLFMGMYFWNNAAAHVTVDVAFVGVIKVFGLRLRDRHLTEGDYRLARFITITMVDMKRKPGETLVFSEVCKDRTLIDMECKVFRRIKDPDNYLDLDDADHAIDGVTEAAARSYIRDHTTDALLAHEGRNGLATYAREQLIEFDKNLKGAGGESLSFADHDAFDVRIEKLQPPASVLAAAAKKQEADQANQQKLIELDGVILRLEKFVQAKTGLRPHKAAEMFQMIEKMPIQKHIIEGLENIGRGRGRGAGLDPDFRTVVTALAEALRRGGTDQRPNR